MPSPVFPDRSPQPSIADLDRALADSATLLHDLKQHLAHHYEQPILDWKYYSKAAGWTLAIRLKRRTVLHLLPGRGVFTVVFVLGNRAVLATADADLPQPILDSISSARDYVEGRSFRFDVATRDDLETVIKLVAVKLAN